MVTFTHRTPGNSAKDWATHPRAAGVPALRLDPDIERLVVLAAHPDDESLGAGGLLAHAHQRGLDVVVVVASDGEASHPESPTCSEALLSSIRRAEMHAALAALAPGAALHLLGLPDGALAQGEDELVATLVELIGDGRHTLVIGPWRQDGHPDHEAAGRAAATTAARTGARLLEYPIWFWHWGRPDQAPWADFRVVQLTDAETLAKASAITAHRSQAQPLSEHPGDEAILSPGLLQHFSGSREIYVAGSPSDHALDDLHARDHDPWGTDSRWYETRKRSLLLAALPREEFRSALEVGCSTGALAADLAPRCHDLVVVDVSPHAVAAADARLGHLDGVRVQRAAVPLEWPAPPEDGFDLIVVSEVGYFLSPRDLEGLVARVRASLAPDGVVVLCDWRHEVVGWPLDGPAVHEAFTNAHLRPVVARYVDRDVELLVLAAPGVLPDPRASS